jgi:lipoate-protein ligase A
MEGAPPGLHPAGDESNAARASLGPLAAGPCFQEAAPGEVVVAGRKVIGSAQRFERKTILQHGSILIDGDQSVVVRIQRGQGLAPASTGIRQVIGREPGIDELCTAVTEAFSDALDEPLDPEAHGTVVLARARELEPAYRSDEWTWRR